MADYRIRPEVTEHIPGLKIGGSSVGVPGYRQGLIRLSDCKCQKDSDGNIAILCAPDNLYANVCAQSMDRGALSYSSLYAPANFFEEARGHFGPWEDILYALSQKLNDSILIGGDTFVAYPRRSYYPVTIASLDIATYTGDIEDMIPWPEEDGDLWYVCPDLDYNAIIKAVLQAMGIPLMSLSRLRSK